MKIGMALPTMALRTVTVLLLTATLAAAAPIPAPGPQGSSGTSAPSRPANFSYVDLWVDSAGGTHIQRSTINKEWQLAAYAVGAPQWQRTMMMNSTKILFTEIPAGLVQDWHHAPAVQYVICLSGAWDIKTTDGMNITMGPGDVLFQDDVINSPARKTPVHYTTVPGPLACQQMIIQVNNTAPRIDTPNAL